MKPEPCPCGVAHRKWTTAWECRMAWRAGRRTLLVSGDGPWASIAWCGRAVTVHLRQDREAAEKEKAFADRYACGGFCGRDHEVRRWPL